MLVDEDEAMRALGDQVARAGLTNWPQDSRRRVAVGLGPRHRGGSVVQRQLRPPCRDHARRGRAVDRPIAERVTSVEGGAYGTLQRGEHRALVAKPHLLLGRVDVDVDQLRVDADVDDRDGVAAALEPALGALLERVDQGAGADRPAVDRENPPVAASPAESWPA